MPFLRVRTVFTGVTGSPWVSTINFGGPAQTGNQTDADAAVAAVGAFWGAVDGNMHTSVTWTTLPDVLFLGDNGIAAASFATTPQVGTGATGGTPLPWATQALVRGLTSSFVGGRQVRGRIFVPGLTSTAVTSGAVATAVQTALTTAAGTLNAVTTPPWAIWSKINATVVPVSSVSVWSQFAVLRSRRD